MPNAEPGITTIAHPQERLGEMAAELILGKNQWSVRKRTAKIVTSDSAGINCYVVPAEGLNDICCKESLIIVPISIGNIHCKPPSEKLNQ